MEYLFEREKENYEDFASGRVLFNRQGTTSFPVRLGSEIFQRCSQYLRRNGSAGPFTLYDPCCGGGYLLTCLGFLHGHMLERIVASDVNEEVVALAERNLSLLSQDGLNRRVEQIRELYENYGKESHRGALESAERIHKILKQRTGQIEIRCFKADALKLKVSEAPEEIRADMIITDLPYGNLVQWSASHGQEETQLLPGDSREELLLSNLLPLMKKISVAAIISDKKQKVMHEKFKRLEQFNAGKRRITLLQPL